MTRLGVNTEEAAKLKKLSISGVSLVELAVARRAGVMASRLENCHQLWDACCDRRSVYINF
jgi:hypothetical protein